MARGPYKPREPGSIKEAVTELFAQIGRKTVAAKLGLSMTQVASLTDERSPEKLSLERAVVLTGPDAPAMAEFFALLARGAFLPMPRTDSEVGALTADAVRQSGEAAAQLVQALLDGRLTPAEARRALPELAEALQAYAQLHATVAAIARNEGIPEGEGR